MVKLSARLSGKETPIQVPDFAFSYTAGGRAPALSFVVSLRAVLFFTVLQCSAHSFTISASFGIVSAVKEIINLAALNDILVRGTG